ncbi:hypothetical protein [Halalkalibacter oceani]|uniref:hypothetical protein n=1 Tax=Halalkalibacter oceani TaxID=1653776 RepID=UPI00339B51B5
MSHRDQRNKQFRREISTKIAEIQFKYCRPCELQECDNCKQGEKLRHYGDLLLKDTQERRKEPKLSKNPKEVKQMKPAARISKTPEEVNGLTKDKYKMLKDEGITDAEIIKAYKLNTSRFSSIKEKWGLLGYRGTVSKNKQKSQAQTVERPESKKPAEQANNAEVELRNQLNKMKDEFNELTQKHQALEQTHEKLLNENSQAAAEFLKIKRELEQTKTAFDELVLQKRDLQNDLSVAERNLDFLREKVEEKANDSSYKQKYLVMAAALKLHLPDGLEVKS